MTTTVIDYYLSPVSPWTYLGAERFRNLAASHNAEVNVFIMDLGVVFPETGGLPLPKRSPQRQAYRLQELARFSEFLDIPLNVKPAHVPPSSPLANLVIMAARESHGSEAAMKASEALLAQIWSQDTDIGDSATVISALNAAGLPGDALVSDATANSDAYAELVAKDSRAAIEANIFGAPSFGVDGEVFWGQDRLDMLAWYLSNRS